MYFLSFWDQFKAAIHSTVKLSNIDKFNYIISYLKDEPLDTICGLTLSSQNYARVVDILHGRYGKKQILISCQMDVLVKQPRVASMSDIPNIRNILNSPETSVQNLTDLNVELNSYGTLLISIIFDRTPNELRITISRKLKNDVWDSRNLIGIFKQNFLLVRDVMLSEKMQRMTSLKTRFHWTLIANSSLTTLQIVILLRQQLSHRQQRRLF